MEDQLYRFCPVCGHALAWKTVKLTEPKRLVCTACGFIFYLDPKVAVGVICTIDGKIVLLQRGIEPALGKWVFPGGFVDRGEALDDAAVREAKEEAKINIKIKDLLNVYSYPGAEVVFIVYTAEIIDGELVPGDEALAVKTFAVSELPWEELAFTSTRQALEDFIDRNKL